MFSRAKFFKILKTEKPKNRKSWISIEIFRKPKIRKLKISKIRTFSIEIHLFRFSIFPNFKNIFQKYIFNFFDFEYFFDRSFLKIPESHEDCFHNGKNPNRRDARHFFWKCVHRLRIEIYIHKKRAPVSRIHPYDELDVFWEWIVTDLDKTSRQVHIFVEGRTFLVLNGSGSVSSTEMHCTCSELHLASGFLGNIKNSHLSFPLRKILNQNTSRPSYSPL